MVISICITEPIHLKLEWKYCISSKTERGGFSFWEEVLICINKSLEVLVCNCINKSPNLESS